MPHKKGLEWNQLQLQIAKEFSLGKKAPQIVKEGVFKSTVVNKVERAIAKGDVPPSLDDAYIAAASPPTKFGSPESKKLKNGAQAPATVGAATSEITEAAILRLIPKVLTLPLTPDIFISFMCAIARGFPGDISEWLSMACRDFWYGREINPYEVVSGFTSKSLKEVITDDKQAAGLAK